MLIEAAILLVLIEAATRTLPFRWVIRLASPDGKDSTTQQPADKSSIRRVRSAVTSAARHLPWKCHCLAQALTASLLLAQHRLPSTLFIGVRKDGEGIFESHAWLCCGQIHVTGAPEHLKFNVIATFGAPSP